MKAYATILILVIVLTGASLSPVRAGDLNLIVITKERTTADRAVIEFDLRGHPSVSAVLQFEVHTWRRNVCLLTYIPTTVSLNGRQLAELAAGENVLKFRGPVGELLKLQANRLTVEMGSCRLGRDELKTVRGLSVQDDPAPARVSLLVK